MQKEGMRFWLHFTQLATAGISVDLETGGSSSGVPLDHLLATLPAVRAFLTLVALATAPRYQQDKDEYGLFWLMQPDAPWPRRMIPKNITGRCEVVVTTGHMTAPIASVTCATPEDAASVASVFADFFARLAGFERGRTVVGAAHGPHAVQRRELSARPPAPPKPSK